MAGMKLPAVFGKKRKVKRVRDGESHRRKCPECGETCMFYEVTVDEKYTAYHVIKLWGSESTGFQCSECDEVMELDDTEEPELTAKEKKALEKKQALEAKERELRAAKARRKVELDAQQQEQAIDDELAAMKKKLGIE
jgi:DNA-binding transcriptional MerR regulator